MYVVVGCFEGITKRKMENFHKGFPHKKCFYLYSAEHGVMEFAKTQMGTILSVTKIR